MYAFKEKFNLNPGFSKQEALEQYSGSRHDLMLGEWASTFAEYTAHRDSLQLVGLTMILGFRSRLCTQAGEWGLKTLISSPRGVSS